MQKIVVNTRTQEQWDFILDNLENKVGQYKNDWSIRKEKSCLDVNDLSSASIEYFDDKPQYLVLGYGEWYNNYFKTGDYIKQEFKTGDYIVPLGDSSSRNNWNYLCLRQKENNEYLKPESKLGEAWTVCGGGFKNKANWRYATREEIVEYKRRGTHYDVRELEKKHKYTNRNFFTFEEGKIYLYSTYLLVRFKKESAALNNTLYINEKRYQKNEYLELNRCDVKLANQEQIEWFEMCEKKGVYLEKPTDNKYNIDDWVLISNDAGGWGSAPDRVNNKILQITKIDLTDRENDGGRYYFGNERTVGKCILRKATLEEIPNHTITIKVQKNRNSHHLKGGESIYYASSIELLISAKQKHDKIEIPLIKKPMINTNKTILVNTGINKIKIPLIKN